MSYLTIVDEADASGTVSNVYAEIKKEMGLSFVPNFMKAQSGSEVVLQATMGILKQVLLTGELSRIVKEMILVAISRSRGCNYCAATHLACCKMLGLDEENLNALAENIDKVLPERMQALIDFVVKSANTPIEVQEADFVKLKEFGFKNSEIIEAVAMTGLSVYLNVIADTLKVELDVELG